MQEFGPYKQQERTRTFQQKLIFQDSPHYAVFTSTALLKVHLFSLQLYDWTQDHRTPRKIIFSESLARILYTW